MDVAGNKNLCLKNDAGFTGKVVVFPAIPQSDNVLPTTVNPKGLVLLCKPSIGELNVL